MFPDPMMPLVVVVRSASTDPVGHALELRMHLRFDGKLSIAVGLLDMIAG